MLTIIIGIIIATISYCLIVKCFKKRRKDTQGIEIIISAMIICIFTILGSTAPLSGFEDWEMENEIELVSFSNTTNQNEMIFAIEYDKFYLYKYKSNANTYKTGTISITSSVQRAEYPKCKNPKLFICTRKPKKTIWTFGKLIKDKKYIFIVPVGTIKIYK